MSEGRAGEFYDPVAHDSFVARDADRARDIPVIAGNVRWERPPTRSFWNALADPEREALAAAGVEHIFRAGAVLCHAGDESIQVMVIDSGWVKVSVKADAKGETKEEILAVRGQGDVVGESAALTTQVRSATVTALDEVSAMVVPAERFSEFLRGHPRATEVLQRQVIERREEDRTRLSLGEPAGAERRLAWLLCDLARRRGGYQQVSSATFTLPMSQQELADWAGTSLDAVGRFLRSWRERGIIARSDRARRLTVVDLESLAAMCKAAPSGTPSAARHDSAPTAAENGPAQRVPPQHSVTRHLAAWLDISGDPLNCSILFTDIAGFGDPRRNDGDREVVRKALYEISRAALEASGVRWMDCYYEDRGDGAVIIVPPTVATKRVVDPLIMELASRLRQHNRRAGDVTQIQLRVALHVGPVGRDAEGLTGEAIIVAARLLEVPVLKERLAAGQADLMFAASDYVYDHVIRHCDGQVDSATFEHVDYQIKKLRISAWIHMAGGAPPAPTPAETDPAGDGQPPASGSWTAPQPVAAPLGRLPSEVRGRSGLLDELRRALRHYPWRASRAFVIAGMGGLGKSTIALEATRMAKARGYRVWWVGAADAALLSGGMLEVLRELRAPESVMAPVREGAPTAPARVWEFLNGEHLAGRRWLLVFDGADSPAVLAGADATTPADGTGWLRSDPFGMVIVTTRNRDPQVWGTKVILRELKLLDDAAGAEVLRDLAPDVSDPTGQEARNLSRRLGGLPLALHLAGAYLGSAFARWSSFAAYHSALDSIELPAALDDIDGPGGDTRATLQRTWDLSLDALATDGQPQARQLLLVLSCFAAATPIPALLLQPQPLGELLVPHSAAVAEGPGQSSTAEYAERLRGLREGLQGLSNIGLIEVSPGAGPADLNAVTMHPVVADVNRKRLSTLAEDVRVPVQAAAAALLGAAADGLDATSPADWSAWRLLFPHVNIAIELLAADLDPDVLTQLLTVSAACTDALLSGGNRVAAEKLAQASVVAATFLSRENPAAMTARGSLALTLVRRGRLGEAEVLYRDLLTDRRQVQGDDHPDTLATRHELAAVIGLQGRFGEAEQLYRQLLDDDYRLLGPDHRHTLAARHNLARMIGRQGRYAEAEELCKKVLDDQRRLLGDANPHTLATQHSLARIIGMSGRYSEAERLYRKVLLERRRVLGNHHPDTLSTRHRLARMIGLQGRYAEAEELCREVLADRRQLLGDEHPDNLATRHRLARMLGLQGRYADAEPLFRQVLAARRNMLGDDHPDTLATGHRLAWLIGRQGRYAEAIEMVSQVLGGRRNILGDDHPDTLAARETLAWLSSLRGRLGEADELFREVLTARLRVLGPRHPDTLATRASLAWLTELKGRYPEAERQYRELLTDRHDLLGAAHPETLATRQDVARLVGMRGRPAEAEQLTRDVLAARRGVLGDDHPDTLTSRAVLAWLAARQGRRAQAEELYRQLLTDRNRVLGASHPDTETTRTELAQLTADHPDGDT